MNEKLLFKLHYLIFYIYIKLSKHSKLFPLWEGICSFTASVQHPPGWYDGSHIAPERPPHTSSLVERRQSDEVYQQIWGLLGGHDGQRPVGKFGQDAKVTPLLFFGGHPGILMVTASQDLGLISHPKDMLFFVLFLDSIISPSLYWGATAHTDHRVSTLCWSH